MRNLADEIDEHLATTLNNAAKARNELLSYIAGQVADHSKMAEKLATGTPLLQSAEYHTGACQVCHVIRDFVERTP